MNKDDFASALTISKDTEVQKLKVIMNYLRKRKYIMIT
jgi:hypothetical protein